MLRLDRPYTVADGDPALKTTDQALFVDTVSHSAFFDDYFLDVLLEKRLPSGDEVPRSDYRRALIKLLAANSVVLPSGRKRIIFAGGGFGAGKTTVLRALASANKLDVPASSMLGTDYFKFFLPEFSRLKRVSDGRASTVVQSECKTLSERLFDNLVERGRSFVWDSSMSNWMESSSKILKAAAKGYELELVAVASNIDDAIFRAMHRAKQIRRFAHPDILERSHREFARYFIEYVPLFPTISVYFNPQGKCATKGDPLLIAQKSATDIHLAVSDEDTLNTFLALSQQ